MATNTPNKRYKLPYLGVGLGLRRSLYEETLAARDKIDWLEIVPENYMGKGGKNRAILEEALETGFPVITHGVNLSVGSVDPVNDDYLKQLQELFDLINPPWFSDHLCFTSIGNIYLHDLIPLPYTWEAVEHVVKKIKNIQGRFEIPFLVENVSYYAGMGHQEMNEAQFTAEILERADCGMLLDVNNIYVNSVNHGFNPVDFLDALPLERVVQVHIAGHHKKNDFIVDTHGAPVIDEVYTILAELLRRTTVNAILLERDTHMPGMEELLDELVKIRQVVQDNQQDKVLVG